MRRIRSDGTEFLLARLSLQVANELAYPFVIEDDGYASSRDENSNAISNQQGIREIYLEAIAVYQHYRKWSEWTASFKGVQGLVEVLRLHLHLPWDYGTLLALDDLTTLP